MSIYNIDCIYAYSTKDLDNFIGIDYETLEQKRYAAIILLINNNLFDPIEAKLILKYKPEIILKWLESPNSKDFKDKLSFNRDIIKQKYLDITYKYLKIKLCADFLDTITDYNIENLLYDEIMSNIPYKIDYQNIQDSLDNYCEMAIKLIYNDNRLNLKPLSLILKQSVENWCDVARTDKTLESLKNLENRNRIFFIYLFSDLVKDICKKIII